MKTPALLATIAAALLSLFCAAPATAHEAVELGPNKGRILELSKDHSMHGEVLVKDGKFVIGILDKDMKAVKLDKQVLTATGGTREKPEKLAVTRDGDNFTLPAVKNGQWLILQYKENDKAKAITARMNYNTDNCDGCNQPEWLCQCKPEKEEKKDTKEAPKKPAAK